MTQYDGLPVCDNTITQIRSANGPVADAARTGQE